MKNTFTDLAQQIEIIQSNSTLPPLIVLEENTNSLFHCRRYEAVTEKLVSRFFGPPIIRFPPRSRTLSIPLISRATRFFKPNLVSFGRLKI